MGRENSYLSFILIIFFYLLIGYVDKNFILHEIHLVTDTVRQDYILNKSSNLLFWESLYATIFEVALLSVLIYVKLILVLACVLLGAIFYEIEFKINGIFKSLIASECVFLFSQILFSLNLYINREEIIYENIPDYYPLSILSYVGVDNVVPWLHYPLQTLNLFEVAYILCISWLLSKQWKPNFIESINIVLPSYGIGLLIWMALVVFLTLQIS